MGQEVQNQGDGGKSASSNDGISFSDVWSGVEKMTGIQAARALFRTEAVSNFVDDFRLLDDGRGSFNDAARKSIEDKLSADQLKKLNDERSDYNKGLMWGSIPSVFAPDLPDKGPLMQKFEKKTDEVVATAEKRAREGMSGKEQKQLDEEVAKYKREQIQASLIVGMLASKPPEKGPMMLEYEKRVLKQIDSAYVNWE
jgi:hypothetical protein